MIAKLISRTVCFHCGWWVDHGHKSSCPTLRDGPSRVLERPAGEIRIVLFFDDGWHGSDRVWRADFPTAMN